MVRYSCIYNMQWSDDRMDVLWICVILQWKKWLR